MPQANHAPALAPRLVCSNYLRHPPKDIAQEHSWLFSLLFRVSKDAIVITLLIRSLISPVP